MPILTIRGIPEHVIDRLKHEAEAERRNINQQVIAILDEALPARNSSSWAEAYEAFREKWGDSLLTDDDVENFFGEMRKTGRVRGADPFE